MDDPTDYAILSSLETDLLVRRACSWGDALARYVEEVGADWESMLGARDTTPNIHYTVDLYAPDGREETVVIMELDDLQAQDPNRFPTA